MVALRNIAASIDKFLRTDPFFRLIALGATVFGFVVAVATIWQISLDISDRREERIIRAWDHLLRPVGGNTGKNEAIELLFSYGSNIDNLHLECPLVDGDGTCINPIIIEGLFVGVDRTSEQRFRPGFQDSVEAKGVILNANFPGVILSNAQLDQWKISNVIAMESSFHNSDLSGASISGDFSDASFHASDLGGSRINAKFGGSSLVLSNVSGSSISSEGNTGSNPPDLSKSWFWADRPPFVSHLGNEIPLEEIGFGIICEPVSSSEVEMTIAEESRLWEPHNEAISDIGSGFRSIPCTTLTTLEQAKERYPERYQVGGFSISRDNLACDSWNRLSSALHKAGSC